MNHLTVLFAFLFLTTFIPLPGSAIANDLTSPRKTSSSPAAVVTKSAGLTGHVKEISLFAVSNNGQLAVTGDEDENNFLWDMSSGSLIREIGKPEEFRIKVVTAVFSPDSKQLLWARTGKIMPVLWDVESGRRLGVLSSKEKGHSANIVSTAFSADGRYIATGDSHGTVVVWNRADRSVVRRMRAHTGEARFLFFIAGKNELVTAGSDGAVRLWGITGTELLATLLEPSEHTVTALTGSNDGHLLYAALEDMTVKGWMVPSRSLRGTLNFDNRLINSIALSPDGNFMALAEENESILLWSTHESKVAWINELDRSATQVRFSPDGKLLFTTGGSNWIHVWDVATGHLVKKIGGADGNKAKLR